MSNDDKETYFDKLDKSSHEFMNTWKRVEGNNVTGGDAHELETIDLLTIVFTAVFMAIFFTVLYTILGA